MRRLFIAAIAIVLSGGLVLAQSPVGTPGMGATSPLGALGSPAAGSPTGIPLGATELDPGGLSPAIGSAVNSAGCVASGSSASSTSSTFDGGGSTTPENASTCTATTSGAIAAGGTASPLSSPGVNGTSALNGGVIPLGATEIGSAGVSPMLGVPAPNSATTPCAGSGVAVASGTTGLAAGSTAMSVLPSSTSTTVGSSFGC